MSEHVYRDSDRVTLYGVEHLVDGTPTTLTVFLKTLDGLYVAADISLLTPVAPPEPPKPAYFEGKIKAGMRFCGEYSAKALYVGDLLPCSLRETSHVFKVERATEAGWETVWPVPEKPVPPKPVYYEGLIPRGSIYVSEGLPTKEHVAGHAFSVSNSSRIIRVKLPTGWETVWPVPEKPAPQIGGEFVLQREASR